MHVLLPTRDGGNRLDHKPYYKESGERERETEIR